MREIKFRAKPVDDFDAQVDADTRCRKYDGYIYGWGIRKYENGKIYLIRFDNDVIEVIPETVGQFVCFSDMNGNEIYEGAKFQHVHEITGKLGKIFKVVNKNGCFVGLDEETGDTFYLAFPHKEYGSSLKYCLLLEEAASGK